MPTYVAQPSTQTYPPFTIPTVSPGIACYSWGSYTPYVDAPTLNVEHAEAIPADGTAGRQFAVRSFSGTMDNSSAITWETRFPSVPSTINVRLQGAVRDVAAEYFDLDTSTNAAGEVRSIALGVTKVNFLRIKVVTSTGGTSPTIVAKFIV